MTIVRIAPLLLVLAAGQAADPAHSQKRMRSDVEALSSMRFEGRASLEPGAEKTATFIADEMRQIGLRPAAGDSFLQPFDLVPLRLDRQRSSIRVTAGGQERAFAPASVFFPDPSAAIDLDLEVVFAGFGITAPEIGHDDYAGLDVRGKAVLVFDHEPQENDPASAFNGTGFTLHANTWTKTWNAERHGAAALLVVTEPVNRHRTAPRAPDRANAPPQALARSELRIPRFSVPASAAEAILAGTGRTPADWQAQIERGPAPASRALDGVRVRLQAANTPAPLEKSWNVAGLLPGSDPRLREETILVTSHHDHLGVQNGKLYPGANDNASGVAAMLETARLMISTPPRRSVLFVAFGSEEQLMLGSYYYVAHPLRPLATTRAVLNLDMIGRNEEHTPESDGAYELTASRPDQLNLVGTPYSPDLLAILERESAGAGLSVSTKFDRDSSMRALFRCDHLPFLQKGVPAVWLFGGFHPGYHEPVDTVDRLDFAKMERVVRSTVASVRALGSAADAPRFTHGTTAGESPAQSSGLNAASETRFADLALACVHKEYPNKIAHVLNGDQDVKAPRDLTPAFYGCYDWHSSVHGHWLLARLARRHPGAPFASPARAALAKSLSAENIAGEVRYLKGAGRVSFERPYGLAWLLQLAAELEEWAAERPDDADVRQWSRAIVPLRDEAIARVREWLPKLTAPIRIGEHSQTAFSFGLMLDWARLAKQSDFEKLLVSRSREFYLGDRACPLAYEPSGEDFLSPCLAEADLMRRVLPRQEFVRWLGAFLPSLPSDGRADWLEPGVVTDPTDPKLGHLHGLNLSRAWMLTGIARSLPAGDPRRGALEAAARAHRDAGLGGVTGEHYEGGHWLGTFAVYLETGRGVTD